ncbi:unnamed protein product [Lactuca virosa]|uniref:Uncharacterized protein n=1 Tax=Lactuca virosa TaxID=75947 RepID=A0AAU9NWV2_9ASTR|nr:unnamed protein product [Lactuca virosa]
MVTEETWAFLLVEGAFQPTPKLRPVSLAQLEELGRLHLFQPFKSRKNRRLNTSNLESQKRFKCSQLQDLFSNPKRSSWKIVDLICLFYCPKAIPLKSGREFNVNEDIFANDSIEMLKLCGIDFKKNTQEGIDANRFGELLMSSGIVLNEILEVKRIGVCHQAGSDSLLTSHAFKKLKESYFNGSTEKYAGVLYGLGVETEVQNY